MHKLAAPSPAKWLCQLLEGVSSALPRECRLDGVAVVEKASIDEAFIACCPPDGTDGQIAFAAGKALAERVKAAGALTLCMQETLALHGNIATAASVSYRSLSITLLQQ